jgi:hypothetical protein
MKENNSQPRLLYLAKLSFTIDGKIKIFHDEEKLKEFRTAKPYCRSHLKESYTQKIKTQPGKYRKE